MFADSFFLMTGIIMLLIQGGLVMLIFERVVDEKINYVESIVTVFATNLVMSLVNTMSLNILPFAFEYLSDMYVRGVVYSLLLAGALVLMKKSAYGQSLIVALLSYLVMFGVNQFMNFILGHVGLY